MGIKPKGTASIMHWTYLNYVVITVAMVGMLGSCSIKCSTLKAG